METKTRVKFVDLIELVQFGVSNIQSKWNEECFLVLFKYLTNVLNNERKHAEVSHTWSINHKLLPQSSLHYSILTPCI